MTQLITILQIAFNVCKVSGVVLFMIELLWLPKLRGKIYLQRHLKKVKCYICVQRIPFLTPPLLY